MGRISRCLTFAPLAILAGTSLLAATAAHAAEPFDNDELVAGAEFQGLPDKDTHSGVFLDLIGAGNASIVQPATYGIAIPAATTSLRAAIFDGNAAGLW